MGFPVGECVYIVHAIELPYYKIGITKDINRRLRALKMATPIDLEIIILHFTSYSHNLEELLHGRFREVRRNNSEWFSLSDKDVEFLQKDTEELFSHFPPIAQKQLDDSPYPFKANKHKEELAPAITRKKIESHTKKGESKKPHKRLNELHDMEGLSWRKIALLDEYKGIPAGSLCSYAKGRIPENNEHRRTLGFPEIIKQAIYRSPIGRFRKAGEYNE